MRPRAKEWDENFGEPIGGAACAFFCGLAYCSLSCPQLVCCAQVPRDGGRERGVRAGVEQGDGALGLREGPRRDRAESLKTVQRNSLLQRESSNLILGLSRGGGPRAGPPPARPPLPRAEAEADAEAPLIGL